MRSSPRTDRTGQADFISDVTTSASGLVGGQGITPTSTNFKELTFTDNSKVDESNYKNFKSSLEKSPQSGTNGEDAADNETRSLSPESAVMDRVTSLNGQDGRQIYVVNGVADSFDKQGLETNLPEGDVDGSLKHNNMTSEPAEKTDRVSAYETSGLKNRSDMRPSNDQQNAKDRNDVSGTHVPSPDLERPHLDTPNEEDSTTETVLAPKIVVVTRDASQYQIPKYSQTFNYNSQPRQSSHPELSQDQDSSRSHHDRRDTSQNIQPPKIIAKSSPSRRSEISRSQQRGPLHFGSLNSGRGDRISAFGTSLNQVVSPRREDPDKLNRERARIERQRQLQERQILMEQRRRRIEQQQEAYNQRLKERNEQLQRRAQLIDPRQQRINADRTEPQVPHRSQPNSDRQEELSRGNQASRGGNHANRGGNHAQRGGNHANKGGNHANRDSGTVIQETAFHVAITDAGPVVTKVRDQRIEGPRAPDESIYRQQNEPDPTSITLKRGPIFAQPEGLTDDSRDESDAINKVENYDVGTDLSEKLTNTKPGTEGDNSVPLNSADKLDSKTEHRKDSNTREDLSTTSPFHSLNKEDQFQSPSEENEMDKTLPYPSYENGATDNKDGPFIRIRQRPEPAGPRYIPVASPESSALTGNDIPFDQSREMISSDLSSTNQISFDYRSPSNEVFPSNILPNQILLTSGQKSRSAAYEWRISGLTDCTHSCGGGAQRTVVVCIDILSQAVVTDENCRQLIKPEVLTLACNKRPCPAVWTPGPWTPCTVTCGPGEHTRTVTCQARVSPTLNLTMPPESCENQEQLTTRQLCNNNPCSTWRVGNWTSCSAGCGDAQRSRDVDCIDPANHVVPDEMCIELKPISEERCNLGECGKGWFFSDWSDQCSVQCGSGQVTRHLFCADDEGNPLPDHRCDIDQRPADTKSCRTSRPCGGIWFTGQWSNCNATCGAGHTKRDVICIKTLPGSLHAVVSDDNCDASTKPIELDQCQGPVCAAQWYMTSWSQCSQSCGTGYRTREVKCLDEVQQPSDACSLNNRPKTREPCNTQQCGTGGGPVPVSSTETQNNDILENKTCEDKSQQCAVVQRARLCRYRYYQRMCCQSCAAAGDA